MLQRSVDSVSTVRWIGSIGLGGLAGLAYFLAARLSLFLLSQPDGVAVFWPAAGIASGALIVFGRDARLPVAVATIVATILANVLSDRTIWTASAKALCNAGEALLVAGLSERYFCSRFNLYRLAHVLALLSSAHLSPPVSGVACTAGVRS